MSKKKNTPRRVSVETRANGEVHQAMRLKSPNFSIARNRKKEANRNRCRQRTGDFYFFVQAETTRLKLMGDSRVLPITNALSVSRSFVSKYLELRLGKMRSITT